MTSTTAVVLADTGPDGEHVMAGSIWMLLSMIAFSIFLLACAWMLLRPQKPKRLTPADRAMKRFARGEVDADDFERTVRGREHHDS